MTIITPLYNSIETIDKTFYSILRQSSKDFRWVVGDDMSTDGTFERLNWLVDNHGHCGLEISLIKNSEKKMAMKNINDLIERVKMENDEIIGILDGDDWLQGSAVKTVLERYESSGCWVTHGSYSVFPRGSIENPHTVPYPYEVIESGSFRSHRWLASHFRTFKYGLWKRISKSDFLDENGEWIDTTYDLAVMFPMLEMAGPRIEFIRDKTYIYNYGTNIHDGKIRGDRQAYLAHYIRSKPRYERLETI